MPCAVILTNRESPQVGSIDRHALALVATDPAATA
jgi:hypothetical protein